MRTVLLVLLYLLVAWFGLVSRLVFHFSVLAIWQRGGTVLTILLFAALAVTFILLYKLIEMIVDNFR